MTDAKEDPLASALRLVEKDSSLNTCRDVLQLIDTGIPPGDPRRDYAPVDVQKVGELARLNRGDIDAIAAKEFSALDPDYLQECLLLRDALRSLELEAFPPEVKAAKAFAWACRQVYIIDEVFPPPDWEQSLPPWVLPAPAWWVLQDGSGCALDRVVIFLGLLQQLGLDGCLIGPPQLLDTPAFKVPKGQSSPSYAPVRAVGVRVGKEILLFDPVLGKPILGPDGKKVATFAALRAKPESSPEWLTASGIKADEIKTWEVFLSVPLSSCAPRMEWLQRQMAAANPVVLATDLPGLRGRFEKEALAADALKGVNCRYWNLPDDALSPTRVLAAYDKEVRTDAGAMISPLKQQFWRSRFPMAFIPPPDVGGFVLEGDAFNRIKGIFEHEFTPVFLTSGSPRDLLLRGQFGNALAALDELDRVNASHRVRIARETNLKTALREWSDRASPVFAAIIRAERSGDAVALAKARADEAEFLKSPASERMVSFVLARTSLVLSGEAKYLIALVLHERAERIQSRLERSPTPTDSLKAEAARSWDNVADNWRVFINNFPELSHHYKRRFDHARQLQQRAEQCRDDAKK